MLPASVKEMINTHGIQKSDRLLIAVSGGVDSVVAAHILKSEAYDIAIAHVNFCLRGDESDGDENFVHELANSFAIPFYHRRFETKNYATQHGISIQMAARELRYSWLRELMHDNNFKYLVTGHHLDDALETALFNFTKGTGISGLRSMQPLNEAIFRPLLNNTRAEILMYAKAHGLSWREDSSNEQSTYARNFIRHEVIPRLSEINPSLAGTYAHTHRRLLDAERVLKEESQRRLETFVETRGEDVYIRREAFNDQNVAITEEMLSSYSLSFSQVIDLLHCISRNEHSRLFFSRKHVLNLDREHLIISPKGRDIPPVHFEKKAQVMPHPLGEFKMTVEQGNSDLLRGPFSASLDFDLLSDELTIRKWRQGDTFRPLGMTGKKKVSDFMIDEKIPLNLKERTFVLESDGVIAWLIGHRISHDFRVTEGTLTRLNIILNHDQSV